MTTEMCVAPVIHIRKQQTKLQKQKTTDNTKLLRKEITMKKIIAMLLAVMIILSLTACGSKKESSNNIKRNESWQDVDKSLRRDLDDMILHTEYDDGVYYVFISIEGVNTSSTFKKHGFDNSFDDLSETIYETAEVENAIVVMAYNNTDRVLYTTYNGTDITDYMN